MSYQRRTSDRDGVGSGGTSSVAPGRRTLTEGLGAQRRATANAPGPRAVSEATTPAAAPDIALDPFAIHLLTDLDLDTSVQQRASGARAASADQTHAIAAEGVRGPGAPLPFLAELKASFGPHGAILDSARAHTDGAAATAAEAIGAQAYTTGRDIAFARAPDRELVAHEAAHVVQQAGGVQLKSGVGVAGDLYEQHADAVAGAFARGESAAPLFDQLPAGQSAITVQRKVTAPPAGAGADDGDKHQGDSAPASAHDLKGAPFEWVPGTYSLWVSRAWFQRGPSAARVRELLEALHRHGMLSWVTPGRIAQAATELVVELPEPVWLISLEAGVFHELGLPPGTSTIVSKAGRGLRAVIAVPDAQVAAGDDFPLSRPAKQRLLGALEGFSGLSILSVERDALLETQLHATLGVGTALFDVHEPMCDRLFGKPAWDQWLATPGEGAAGPQFDPGTPTPGSSEPSHEDEHAREAGTDETATDSGPRRGADDGKANANPQGAADGDARIITPGGEAGGTIYGEVGGSKYGWVQWVPQGTIAITPRQATYLAGAAVQAELQWDFSVHPDATEVVLPNHCDYAWAVWHDGHPVDGDGHSVFADDRTASLDLDGGPGMYEIVLTATSKHFKTERHRFTTRVGLYAVAEEEFQKSAFDAAHVSGPEGAFTRDDKGALHTRPDEHAHTTDQEIAALDMTMGGIDALAQQGKLAGTDRALLHDRLEQQRDALEAIKDKTKAGTPYIVRGTFVSREDASTIPLKLLMHMTRQEVRDGVASYELILHDLTDGEATQHPGSSRWRLDHDAPAKVFRQLEGEALSEMADHFHAHNDYARGTVHLAAQRLTSDDVWESTRDTNNWRKKAKKAVATVGMVGGAVMFVVPGGSVVSTGLLVVTSTAGLASVALELEDRMAKQGGLRFDRRLVMDVLQVAATVLPLGSLSKALAGASAIAKSRFVLSMVTLDAAQGFLIADDTRTQLLLVDANTNLRLATATTAEERTQILDERDHQVAQIIGGAIVNGSFILVSTVGGIKEIVAHTANGVPFKVREPIADIVKQGRPAMEEALTHGSFAHGSERVELTATERRYLEHEIATPAAMAPDAPPAEHAVPHPDGTEHEPPSHARTSQPGAADEARASQGEPAAARAAHPPAAIDPIARSITTAAELTSTSNRVVGKPISVGEGLNVVRALNENRLDALAAVGVDVPAGTALAPGIEFGLGEMAGGKAVVVLGELHAVDWAHLPGVTPRVHTHPSTPGNDLRRNTGAESVPLARLLEPTKRPMIARELVFPSVADVALMARLGVDGHRVITPFVVHDGQVLKPKAGDHSPRLEWVIQQPREVGRTADGSTVYEATLFAEVDGKPVAETKVWSTEPSDPSSDNPGNHYMAAPEMTASGRATTGRSMKTPSGGSNREDLPPEKPSSAATAADRQRELETANPRLPSATFEIPTPDLENINQRVFDHVKRETERIKDLTAEGKERLVKTGNEAAESTYRSRRESGADASKARKAAGDAAKRVIKELAVNEAEAIAKARAEQAVADGSVFDLSKLPPDAKAQLEAFRAGTSGEAARRLAPELAGKDVTTIETTLDAEVRAGVATKTSQPIMDPVDPTKTQTQLVYEFTDGTVIRVKPRGDVHNVVNNTARPMFSIEVKQVPPSNSKVGQEGIAFKVNDRGQAVPKGPYEISNPYEKSQYQLQHATFHQAVLEAGHQKGAL